MPERYPDSRSYAPPIFEISRTNPRASWGEVVPFPFDDPRQLFLFDSLLKHIANLANDHELLAIQVIDDGENLHIRPVVEDVHAETNFSGLFQAGLAPSSLCFLNGAQVEDVVSADSSNPGQTVGVLKFVP